MTACFRRRRNPWRGRLWRGVTMLMVLGGVAHAQDRQAWIERVEALEPDGIVWARPAVGVPPRVLFVAHQQAVGEAACVARCLDMDWDVVGWPSPWNQPGAETVAALLKVLEQDWDVLVLGGPYSINNFPLEARHEVYRKLVAGMGLVHMHWTSPFPKDLVAKGRVVRGAEAFAGVPFDAFESIVAEKDRTQAPPDRLDEWGRFVPRGYTRVNQKAVFEKGVEINQIGQCRLVTLPFSRSGWGVHASFVSAPWGDYTPDQFIGDEYYLSLLCKAIRWAAKREPAVTVQSVSTPASPAPVGSPVSVKVGVQAAKAMGGATLEWDVRTAYLRRVAGAVRDVSVAEGLTEMAFEIPPLDADLYYVNVWIRKDGRTVDWGSAVLRVAGSGGVAGIQLSQKGYARGEPVKGQIEIRDALPGAELNLQVVDAWERIIAGRKLAAKAGKQAFTIPIDPSIAGLAFSLRASLVADGKVQARANFDFPIRQPAPDFVFNMCVADDRSGAYLMRLRQRLIARYRPDTDNYWEGGYAYPALRLARTTGIASQARPFLYGGLVAREKMDTFVAAMKHAVTELGPQGLLYCNTGDDTGPATGVPDAFMGDFEAYLREQYGTLESIRKEWGPDLKAWGDVTNQFVSVQKEKGNLAPNTDMMRFCEDRFYKGLEELKAAGQSVQPGVAVGQFAVGGFGNDFQRYLACVDYFAPYYRDTNVEILGAFHGKTQGYYGSNGGYFDRTGAPNQRANEPWYTLLCGGNIVHNWYTPANLDGDFSVHPLKAGVWYEAAREIRSGIDVQVLRSVRVNDPVAILWAEASGYASAYDSTISEIANSRAAFNRIVDELGLQYIYIGNQHLTDGVLKKEKIKLLILPYSQAMSAAEADAIRRFVAEGGTVLADTRPAVWNEHCRRLDQGLLDDVFGMARKPLNPYVAYGELVCTDALPGLAQGTVIDQATVDRSVTPTTAHPYGTVAGTPAILVNTVGKGRAVLLNTFVGRYPLCQADGASGPWTALYRWIFQQAGVQTDRVGVGTGGQPAIGARRVHFLNGDMEILGVRKHGLGFETYPVMLDFKLPAARHVYDMRSGTYLGNGVSFKAGFQAIETRFFALLPYQVKAVRLDLPKVGAPGQVLAGKATIETEGGKPAAHALSVRVKGPDGGNLNWFEQTVWAPKGSADIRLPIAVNEAAGAYEVTIRDIPTGVSAQRVFNVRPQAVR